MPITVYPDLVLGEAMKPRLVKFRGLWYCVGPRTSPLGLGFTPEEAFLAWEALKVVNV
jgi:hypothetical protein